ncbi:MAG: hypothetical protein E3J72_01560 [Planctomycetota bacterium]|nr:MAG: hypothetical protein E3J72_01560 [Planctomycetota bacterium]
MGMKKIVLLSVLLAAGLCLALFLVEIGLASYLVPAATTRDMIIQQNAPVQNNPQNAVAGRADDWERKRNAAGKLQDGRDGTGQPASLNQRK